MSGGTVYSSRIFAGAVPANATVALGTVPNGEVWVIRCINVLQVIAANARVQVLANPGNINLVSVDSTQGAVSKTWEGRMVANSDEQLSVYAQGTAATVSITAYRLGTAAG